MAELESLEPIKLETTAGIIADRIRQAIAQGRFPPGAQLGEAQLAEQLNVSRGPVREALQRLVQEGLLYNERHRGVFVSRLEQGDVADVYLVRGAIERAAALVVMRDDRGSELFEELEGLLTEMAERARGDDWAAVSDLDLRFHETLVRGSGSKRLNRMFRTLLVETRMCMGALRFAYPDAGELVEEHRSLLAAMREGEEERALGLLEAHMDKAVRDLSG